MRLLIQRSSHGRMKMKRSIIAFAAACLLALGLTTPSFCQDLVGTVVDQDGHAVSGAKIVTQSPDGQPIGSAVSDANGQYQINGVNAGEYFITLAPAGTAGQGQTVASYVGNGGLTVNWAVAPGVAPVASAKAGTTSVASTDNPVSICRSLMMSGRVRPACALQNRAGSFVTTAMHVPCFLMVTTIAPAAEPRRWNKTGFETGIASKALA